jgi:hypothetical protein
MLPVRSLPNEHSFRALTSGAVRGFQSFAGRVNSARLGHPRMPDRTWPSSLDHDTMVQGAGKLTISQGEAERHDDTQDPRWDLVLLSQDGATVEVEGPGVDERHRPSYSPALVLQSIVNGATTRSHRWEARR